MSVASFAIDAQRHRGTLGQASYGGGSGNHHRLRRAQFEADSTVCRSLRMRSAMSLRSVTSGVIPEHCPGEQWSHLFTQEQR